MDIDVRKLNLDSATSWLLSAGGDKDDKVRHSVVTALCIIAKSDNESLLNSLTSFYLMKDPKKQLSPSHRLTLIRVALSVWKERMPQIQTKILDNLIKMAINEMTRNPELSLETQYLASDLLVSLGSKSYCMEVMDVLMNKLESGMSPHPSLLHCFAELASVNAFGMVPFIRGTLGILLPSSTSFSGVESKRLFCSMIRSFAEAIEEYMVNLDRAPDPNVNRQVFTMEMNVAYDELSSSWIHSRDPLICQASLSAIGPLLSFLPKEKAVDQLPILAASLIALYRQKLHSADPLAITNCLWHLLSLASSLHHKSLPDPLPEQLLKAAFDQVAVKPDISTPLLVKNHYEALRCIQVLGESHWRDVVWELLLHKLKGVHVSGTFGVSSDHILSEQIKALWTLAHLISSAKDDKSPLPWISQLVPILRGILSHSDTKTKKVLVRVIVALLSKDYLKGADSRPFLEFIIMHSNHSPFHSSYQSSVVDEQADSDLGQMCCHSLNLLASTVPNLKDDLRALLINILIYPPALSHVTHGSTHENHLNPHSYAPSILRCLSLLMPDAEEQKEMVSSNVEGATESNPSSLPEALAVLARCLTILAHPLDSSISLSIDTLSFLKNYSGNLHHKLPLVYSEKIPVLIKTLRDFTGGASEFDLSAWFHLMVDLMDSSLAVVSDDGWTKAVGKALTSLLFDATAALNLNSQPHIPRTFLSPKQRCLVYSLLGAVGVWCTDEEYLKSCIIETLLSSPYDVTSPAEAEACASAIGRVAKRHSNVVLKALIHKSKDFNSGSVALSGHTSGLSNAAKQFIQRLPFGKSSHHVHEEARRRKEAGHQRANVTLLLCYGRASLAIAGDSSTLASFLDSKSSQETGAIAWILQHFDPSKGLDVRLAALTTLRQICYAILPQNSPLMTVDSTNNNKSPISPATTQAMRQTVLTLIGAELPLLAPAIQTLNLLMKIVPPMNSDERITILRICLDTVFPLTADDLEVIEGELFLNKTSVSRVRGGSASFAEYDEERDGVMDKDEALDGIEWICDEYTDGKDMNHMCLLEALNQLQSFVTSILIEKTCAGTLGEIFSLLEVWMSRPGPRKDIESSGSQRMAAMLTLQSALSSYLKNFKLTFMVPSKFTECGWMVGAILPRCSDSYLPIRSVAVNCLQLLLTIVSRYDEGLPAEQVEESDYMIKSLSISDEELNVENKLERLVRELGSQNPDSMFHAMEELAKISCMNLRNTYILSLVEALLDRGLGDIDQSSSAGASVALNSILKVKGGLLINHVPHILDMMLGQVSKKTCPSQTSNGAIRSVLVLATHHPKATVSALLLQSLPFDNFVIECWKILAQDPSLNEEVLRNLLAVVEEYPPYEAQDGDSNRDSRKIDHRDSMKVANLAPLTAISAMQEMLKCAVMQSVAQRLFPELLCALLMTMSCYIGASPPIHTAHRPTPAPLTMMRSSSANSQPKEKSGSRFSFVPNRRAYKLLPARIAQGALQALFLCSGCDLAAEALLNCSNIESEEHLSSFIEMMPILTRALCKEAANQLPQVADCLNHYASSASANEAQLVTVTTFYAELINLGGNGSDALAEVALEQLLTLESGDSPFSSPASSPSISSTQERISSPLLRILCLRGLSNATYLINHQEKSRWLNSILGTLVRGVGDGTVVDNIVGCVALESMNGLCKLLPVIQKETVREVGVTVALHIKPYFDKENNALLRSASIYLLGNIAKYGIGNTTDNEDEPVVSSSNWHTFEEHVKSNLVCLLLRLADSEEEVVKSCKFALREMSQIMDVNWHAKKVSSMIKLHLIDSAVLQYEKFMADLVKLMVEEFPEDHLSMLISSATSYIHAPSAVIRGSATFLLGQFFGCMESKKREGRLSANDLIPMESLSAKFSQLLLSDPDAEVRSKAAQAIARLFE